MKIRVGIVFGGNSVEHEISILSAIQANYAIDLNKYDVYNIYMTKDGKFWVGDGFSDLETFKKDKIDHHEVVFSANNSKAYLKGIKRLPRKYKKPIDVILPIVHGKNVEDGSLAGYFNILNVPFAASNVLVSAIIQNKLITKKVFQDLDINLLDYEVLKLAHYLDDSKLSLENIKKLGFPLIIKPISLGSSVGIKIAANEEELIEAIQYGFKYESELIIEKKLSNFKEFNQAVLDTKDGYKLSSVEEVININPFLTFSDKYLPSETRKEIPAKISADLASTIGKTSLTISQELSVSGVIRIDYLYDLEQDVLYLNEINAIPGSLSYYLYEEDLSFPNLIDILINTSIKRHYLESLKLNSFKSNVLSTTKILKK